ncbi:asparagine synthase-related protein [Tunturiibacter gelidoferens]|uniref:asparagine synthase (glutamine-hydrolyzing) n=1 Tax=Tunturiibacter gelidiferens TaxID=3069689 RepID=A0AAU7Z0I8_9BACT
MSIIFGTCRPQEQIVESQELLRLAALTEGYVSDGTFRRTIGRVGMGFQPLHTTRRSRSDSQPVVDAQNNMLVLDGRLDNRSDLRTALDIDDREISDSSLILAAFERWGESSIARFVGDWAFALWCGSAQELYLARDHAGTRSLYFNWDDGILYWSTYLETLVGCGRTFALNEQYAMRFLCGQSLHGLTPYRNIWQVPPAHYVLIRDGTMIKRAHWQPRSKELVRYTSDGDYEEQFFVNFKQAVGRRDHCGDPILAHLSGGMDSTAIVCMSDFIRRSRGSTTDSLLDTLSYYDPSEPNWDEERYFSITEARRGKTGIHVNLSTVAYNFVPPEASAALSPLPGNDKATLEWGQEMHRRVWDRGYRVILSGIGGDEFLGGVPTPLPELANYVVSADIPALLKQSLAWCVFSRSPLVQMLYRTTKFTLGLYSPWHPTSERPGWISRASHRLGVSPDDGAFHKASRLWASPSAICNFTAWWDVVDKLPHLYPEMYARYEYRYPILDRDLIEFLFSLPREQLVQPGRRRSLMRRALRSIVPVEILERKRKAYISRSPRINMQSHRDEIESLVARPLLADYGLIDADKLQHAAARVINGSDVLGWAALRRTLVLEVWLRAKSGVLMSAAT